MIKVKNIFLAFILLQFSVSSSEAFWFLTQVGEKEVIKIPATSTIQADNDDIRIAQGIEVVPHWIEYRTEQGTNTTWTRLTLHPGMNTQYYLYYNNPDAIDLSNFDNVFTKASIIEGLVGFWDFDEGAPSTIVIDRSPFGNTGTLHGPTWVGRDGGQWNGRETVRFNTGDSLFFDGGTDFISIPRRAWLEQATFSVAFWMFPREIRSGNAVAGITNPAWTRGWGFDFYGRGTNTIAFWVGDYGDHNAATGTVIVRRWNHIVGNYNRGRIELYINAVLVDIGTPTIALSYAGAGDLLIGRLVADAYDFHGELDDFRKYSRNLTPGEVRALYERRLFSPATITVTYRTEETGNWTLSTGEIFTRRRLLEIHNSGTTTLTNFQVAIPIRIRIIGWEVIN